MKTNSNDLMPLFALELNEPEFTLDDSFLDEYTSRRVAWGPVGYVTYKRTYSRKKLDGSSEEWWETVRRVVEGTYQIQQRHCHFQGLHWESAKAQRSAREMFDRIFTFRFTPPGRGLWMMGTYFIRRYGSAPLQNCGFFSTENIGEEGLSSPMCYLMDLSMLGVGVGFDTRGAGKIRVLKPILTDEVFVIPDSREGWVDALRRCLDAWTVHGQLPHFDYSRIRGPGEPIKGFGGIAAGPEPLRRLIEEHIPRILMPLAGRLITSEAISDIGNVTGVCVVSGNVRRSAEIVLGAPNDFDFVKLKDPDINSELLHEWRWAANMSILAELGMNYTEPAKYTEKNGEPGYVWLENMRRYGRMIDPPNDRDYRVMGCNPCVEQSLEDKELCVSGDTRILTSDGYPRIKDVVGKEVRIWNGKNWSYVTPFLAGSNKKLYRVHLSDGSYLDVTGAHGWSARPKTARQFRRIETKDLTPGMVLEECTPPVSEEGIREDNAYTIGWFTGDGFMDGTKAMVLVQSHEYEALAYLEGTPREEQHPDGYAAPFRRVAVSGVISDEFGASLRDHESGLPDEIFSWDVQSLKDFFGGWIDTDGALCKEPKTDGYRLYGSEMKLRDAQMLLRRIGINHSTLRLFGEEGEETNFGIRNYDLFYLQIPSYEAEAIGTKVKVATRFGSRYRANNEHPRGEQIDAARKQKVVWVEPLDGVHDTYCFTEPHEHKGVFGNVITYQCNLVETYPAHHSSLNDYLRTLKFAYLYGKSVTLLPTHHPEINKVMLRNRRIGCSQSGVVQSFQKIGRAEHFRWSDEGYKYVRKLDTIYSEWLGIPESIKVTSIKPSGCRPVEALTATSMGLLTLEEIFELSGHQVGEEWHECDTPIAALGAGQISKTYDNGEQDVLRIRLSYGMELESTPNHQWFVKARYDHGKKERYAEVNEWRRADELQLNDILDVDLKAYRREHAAPLAQVNPLHLHMRSDARRIRQPSELTPDLAWFIGYLWGDGCQSPEKFRIRFTDENLDNLEKAQRVLQEQFDIPSNIHSASEGRQASVLEVGSKHLWHWLIRNDVWKYFNSGLSDVPRIVRASGHEQIIAFMAGWLDSDGCVSPTPNGHKVIWTTSDTTFARHAQDVLWAVGFGVGRSLNEENEQRLSAWGSYLMTLGAHVDADAFSLLVKHSTKAAKVGSSGWHWQQAKPRMIIGKVVGVEEAGRKPTFDFEVPGEHWYWAGSVRSHNTVSKLCGATSGMHRAPAEYYIQRIRFAANSELLAKLQEAGYPTEPDVYSPDTVCVEFPIKEKNFEQAETDVPAAIQLADAVKLQEYWADNQVSCTVKFEQETEGPHIKDLLELFQTGLKGISFLPYTKGKESVYKQSPWEPISKEEYERRAAAIRELDTIEESAHEVTDAYCDSDRCELSSLMK